MAGLSAPRGFAACPRPPECAGNEDIAVFVPQMSAAIQNPENVPECVEGLAGCVFVQEVEAAALAITTPILLRGLNGKTDVKRKCCIIIENMCKLVNDPKEVARRRVEELPALCGCAARSCAVCFAACVLSRGVLEESFIVSFRGRLGVVGDAGGRAAREGREAGDGDPD